MKALITGASSGIGKNMAYVLANKGIDLILVARNKDELLKIKANVKVNVEVIELDLLKEKNVFKLYEMCKDRNIDILINNAGFGLFGLFTETDLDREIEMIDLNIKAYHILTKLFLKDFVEKDNGYILNVASSAGLLPAGPYMAAYYATKSYVASLTRAVARELKERGSHVYAGALCPGPVDTEFNQTAHVSFALPGITPEYCVKYAIRQMKKRKVVIIPTALLKIAAIGGRFIPQKLLIAITGRQQKKKFKR